MDDFCFLDGGFLRILTIAMELQVVIYENRLLPHYIDKATQSLTKFIQVMPTTKDSMLKLATRNGKGKIRALLLSAGVGG